MPTAAKLQPLCSTRELELRQRLQIPAQVSRPGPLHTAELLLGLHIASTQQHSRENAQGSG